MSFIAMRHSASVARLAKVAWHLVLGAAVGFLVIPCAIHAEEPAGGQPEPALDSLFPLGGTRATSFDVKVRGAALSGTQAAWFADREGVNAEVVSAGDNGDEVQLRLTVDSGARIGAHALRLVSPRGVSNPLFLHVHAEPAVTESSARASPGKMKHARPVGLPVVVNGTITRQGERDFFAIDVDEGESVATQVIVSRESLKKGFRPQLRLHDPTGSWFDPQKLTQLAFHSEIIEGDTPISSPLVYRFEKAGRYLVEVGSERHKGAADYSYQLRIVSISGAYRRYAGPPVMVARSFLRRLTEDRVSQLWSRAVAPNAGTVNDASLKTTSEHEPNDNPAQAMPVSVPTLVEGVIAQPGDVDRFTFRVNANQRLAFEIETFGAMPPHFNPRLEITDSSGRSILTNIHKVNMPKSRRWDLKRLEPKIIQGFERAGEYSVEVRDVTSRAGGANYQYRMLIRLQVPHVGDVKIATLKPKFEDDRIDPLCINLLPSEARTLTVTTPIEEIAADVVEAGGTRRFTSGAGEVAMLVENLPQGVRAYPGGYVQNTRDDDMESAKAYSLLPDVHKSTIVLEADANAPVTKMPQLIRVVARPLVEGRPGARIIVDEIPLMVPRAFASTAPSLARNEPAKDQTAPPVLKESVADVARLEESQPEERILAEPTTEESNEKEDAPAPTMEPTLLSLRIEPATLNLRGVGSARRFLVLAHNSDGLERDVTSQCQFAVSPKGVIDVTDGKATALAEGAVELTANFSRKTITAAVSVVRATEPRPSSFARDIGGILTKHGCNSQKCHGSVKGKGGFKLSINAVFARKDFRWIVEGGTYHVMKPDVAEPPPVPRVNLSEPAKSLLLRKATESVAHGGGRVLSPDGEAYATIKRWIENGATYGPDDPDTVRVQRISAFPKQVVLQPSATHRLLVTAHSADDRQDDVTDRVRYESNDLEVAEVTRDGIVTARRAGETDIIIRAAGHAISVRVGVVDRPLAAFPEPETRNFIDEHVFAKLRRFHILPSQLSTDSEFLRRVCLDICGTLPPPMRAREFLDSSDPRKRDKLIETLLESPEYVEFWTYRFSELFRVYSGATLNAEHAQLHEDWIRTNVAQNKPYDQVARDRIAAQGYNSPAWHYWTFRDLTPAQDVATEQFRVFMGRRLGCAQCHDHPFENWSQDQLWGTAAFFGNMTRIFEVAGVRGPYFVFDDPEGFGFRKIGRGRPVHPRTQEEVQPTFLDGQVLSPDQRLDLRMRLAEWMTAPENPYFAEAIVNRMWSYFFGRGIVHPVDDFRTVNPPTHPDLLAALARDFVAHKYDLKHLIRTIAHSRTYQLSGKPNPGNERDELNYSRAYPRLVEPPVLLDAIAEITGIESELVASVEEDVTSGVPVGMRAINVLPNDTPCTFFEAFNRNDRRGVPEDRPQLTVLRSLHRLVGPTFTKGFIGRDGRLDKLLTREAGDQEIIEELYLAAVSRLPTDRERKDLERLIADQPSRDIGLESLMWALLNAREFVYNH